mmetsp:Transcript_11717/g.23758  ORF Transcript_11717/g.23758 Transcript_11717/m.23758 type:complete len:212 (+) Transcript_11717:457-1092(+)
MHEAGWDEENLSLPEPDIDQALAELCFIDGVIAFAPVARVHVRIRQWQWAVDTPSLLALDLQDEHIVMIGVSWRGNRPARRCGVHIDVGREAECPPGCSANCCELRPTLRGGVEEDRAEVQGLLQLGGRPHRRQLRVDLLGAAADEAQRCGDGIPLGSGLCQASRNICQRNPPLNEGEPRQQERRTSVALGPELAEGATACKSLEQPVAVP